MNFKIIKSAKISVKLTLIYAFMFSVVLLILNAAVLYGVKYYFYSQANKQVEDIKTIMINKISNKAENIDLADKEFFSDIPSKENIFIKIVQENGKQLNVSNRFNYTININRTYNTILKMEEQERHFIYENVKIQDNKYGTVYIQIVKDLGNEYGFIKILFIFMAIADFIGIIASILLGYILSKRMLTPIDNITTAAQKISINNLKERIEVNGPDDELNRLASTLNNMIDRLQGAFDKQVQFVSDASHELRTPIAVIQGYANLLDRWGKDDREALEKSISAIKFETESMVNLVEKLLILAKGDSGNQKIEKNKFFLNELICEVVKESRIIDDKHFISNNRNDVVSIFADYKMIKEMLRIFIDNSIKYTPEHGSIDISSTVCGEGIKIAISDTGIGIPKDEIENVFDRFYCVDKSRSKEKGGSGLGLSIAKWIVDVHNGTISIESEEGKGTKINVIFNLE